MRIHERVRNNLSRTINDIGSPFRIAKAKLFQNQHIVSKLKRVVSFEFAIAFIALKSRAGFDVAGNVAAAAEFQDIRFTDQIAGSQTTAVNEGLPSSHRCAGFLFARGDVDQLHVRRDV